MSFSGFPFPPETPIFPKAHYVQSYLASYADTFRLRPFIRFNTRVAHMDYLSGRWVVKTSSRNVQETLSADLVMVCNGHYASPRYPDTHGLRDWIEAGLATHSMWYRHPPAPPPIAPALTISSAASPRLNATQITILVVGSGPSGQDLCADFLALTHRSEDQSWWYTIIHSTTDSVVEDVPQSNGNTLKRRGRVAFYHPLSQDTSRSVTLESGETISGIDHVYLATGYDYTYPFIPSHILEPGYPPPPTASSHLGHNGLWNSGHSVGYLARHLWPLRLNEDQTGAPAREQYPPTSLAFLGLLSRVSPFPLVEVQALAALAAFASPSLLNIFTEKEDVLKRYERLKRQEERPDDDESRLNERTWKGWHKLEPMEQ